MPPDGGTNKERDMKQLEPNARKNIVAAINEYRAKAAMGEKLATALKKFEGKQITKALITAMEKAIPGISTYYDADEYRVQMYVWGLGIPYDKRVSIYISTLCMARPAYHEADFRTNWGTQFFNATRWADDLEAELPQLDNLIAQFTKSRDAYELAIAKMGNLTHYALTGSA